MQKASRTAQLCQLLLIIQYFPGSAAYDNLLFFTSHAPRYLIYMPPSFPTPGDVLKLASRSSILMIWPRVTWEELI